MNATNPQINADFPVRRDANEFPTQPQSQQGLAPAEPAYARDEQPVGAVAQGDSDTFEVSMDDWFKA